MNTNELQEAYGPVIEFENEDGEISYGRFTDARNSYRRVRQFHEVFGHPIAEEPSVPADERIELRLELIREEFCELLEAAGYYAEEFRDAGFAKVGAVNIIDVADALGDIEYVVNGAALEFGIPLPAVVAEIHDSNMTKLGKDGKPIYREDGKVKKGPKYRAPNLIRILWPR